MENPKSSVKAHNSVKVMPAPAYLVQYTDGNGSTETKVCFIVGDEVRFLANGGLSKPAQAWLKNDILIALGLKEDEPAKPQVLETPTLDRTEQV